MQNPTYDDYEKIKREAKAFYDGIGQVWCPALGDYIFFRKAGFRHLIWSGRTFRVLSEQKRRLGLLPHIPEIIQDPAVEIVFRSRGKVKFWGLKRMHNGKTINIIIMQIGKGDKHFVSVFEER